MVVEQDAQTQMLYQGRAEEVGLHGDSVCFFPSRRRDCFLGWPVETPNRMVFLAPDSVYSQQRPGGSLDTKMENLLAGPATELDMCSLGWTIHCGLERDWPWIDRWLDLFNDQSSTVIDRGC